MRDLARQPLTIIMGLEWAFCHTIVGEMTHADAFVPFCKILPLAGAFRCLNPVISEPSGNWQMDAWKGRNHWGM
jgi:hypothetical protein